MDVLTLIGLWDRVRSGLIETISKFEPQDLTFVPFDGGFSVRGIVLHIAQEELGEIQYGITGDLSEFPPEFPEHDYPNREALVGQLAQVHGGTIAYLKTLTNEALAGKVEAGWGGTYPLFDLIWHVVEHEIHHRGELSLIHGLLGREGLDA